ncbi:FAD-binding protein [Marinibactrum halimedae]|uniref:L-gulonolactone oxidase n=1 Tax=Marinibactrum halimedae TaxID=1444977 RepID=A0AA37T4T1_9GAMM|nr:FAD-binding protein [Marinibactrum halimedae]MCD9459035.1 FAD-binding protein [Marinibactrum halimedae]GLS26835.1 L-gulonolactone oxidase [Marinibactrum halimedae]
MADNITRSVLLSGLCACGLLFYGCYSVGMFGPVFKNVWGTEIVEPEFYANPSAIEELIEIVIAAEDAGKRVRMTGSGHSPSDIAVTKEVLLYPPLLTGPLELDNSQLRNPNLPNIARVKSGTSLRDLNTYFEGIGMAFPNLGGWDEQTIAGAVMTATHGSGLDYGPIESTVLSMQVVSNGGEVLQIEPTQGITNPHRFSGFLPENPDIPVRLIQDDETFQAMKVSIGSMGIVYSYILQLEPAFWINENRTLTTWSNITSSDGFLTRLVEGRPLNPGGTEPDYYELQVNPYPTVQSPEHHSSQRSDYNVLLTQRWKSYSPLPVDRQRAVQGSEILQAIAVAFQPVVEGAINLAPQIASSTIDTALRTQVDDSYTNISHRVFNIGLINRTEVYAIEIAFTLDDIIPAMERQFELVASLKTRNIVQSAPVAIRFVKPSDAHIAMMEGRATAMMELINLQGLYGVDTYFQQHQQVMFTEFDSRPHWGLDLNYFQGEDMPRNVYPRWDDWRRLYNQFNAKGTFNGKVTDRLGISVADTVDNAKNHHVIN